MFRDRVRYLVVLALENRSFDHVLARRFNPNGAPWVTPPMRVQVDPGHEFGDVSRQLRGEWPSPFPGSQPASPEAIRLFAYEPRQVPVINALADNFVLFDRWFSSVPGPTWPNRYFMHAGTSGGLVVSPNPGDVMGLLRGNRYDWAGLTGFEFQAGTVFDALDRKRTPWRIYHGDSLPQSASLHGMPAKYVFGWTHGSNDFRSFQHFADDLQKPGFPQYTFIEPNWDVGDHYAHGNSQHPYGDVAAGEALIKSVYEALRRSEYWNESALLILYDEHGGFFDSVQPGKTVATGDDARYADPSEPFDFTQLGFRVPALLVSPWVTQEIDSTVYDHAALPHLISELFGIPMLTDRVRHQPSLERLFRKKMRTETPIELPTPYTDATSAYREVAPRRIDRGFLSLAMMLDAALGTEVKVAEPPLLWSRSAEAKYLFEVEARLRSRRIG